MPPHLGVRSTTSPWWQLLKISNELGAERRRGSFEPGWGCDLCILTSEKAIPAADNLRGLDRAVCPGDVLAVLTCHRTTHSWRTLARVPVVQRWNPMTISLPRSNLLSCLKKYNFWWALLIAFALAFQLRSLDTAVLRNLNLSTIWICWPSMNKGSERGLILAENVMALSDNAPFVWWRHDAFQSSDVTSAWTNNALPT